MYSLRNNRPPKNNIAFAMAHLNVNWIYTLPGSLLITAVLAWPVSKQGSSSLFERIRFCLASMLGVALFLWGFEQPARGMNDNLDPFQVVGSSAGVIAAAFLMWLWFDKLVGIVMDLLLGCFDILDQAREEGNLEVRQIKRAVRLYRQGRHQLALRLCEQIIDEKSRYASAAATLAYWIEGPDGIKILENPRTALVFKGKYSDLNLLLMF